jgi:hypothetical protein
MKTDDQTDDIQAPSKAGWPARYFSVIFTAQRTLSDEDMYSLTSERMVELAQQQPGFLGLESVRGEDGIGITVSYWRDRAAIRAWRSMLNIWPHNRWDVRNSTAGITSVWQRWWRIAHLMPVRR